MTDDPQFSARFNSFSENLLLDLGQTTMRQASRTALRSSLITAPAANQFTASDIEAMFTSSGLGVKYLTNQEFEERCPRTRTLNISHGVSSSILRDLGILATKLKTLIFIRATSAGAAPMFISRTAYGKPLYVKSKSSDKIFTNGQICLLGNLAKDVTNINEARAAQASILETLNQHHFIDVDHFSDRKLCLIPKFLKLEHLKSLGIYSTNDKIDMYPYQLQRVPGQDLYQLFFHFPESEPLPPELGNLNADQLTELIEQCRAAGFAECFSQVEDSQLVPVHIICEVVKKTTQLGPEYYRYPLSADYDLFAICPFEPWVERDFQGRRLKPEHFLPKYDAEKGAVSNFEKLVAEQINEKLGIKVARHGCEVNNYQYTSKLDSIIAIAPAQMRNAGFIINWSHYLELGLSSHASSFIFPVNFNWSKATQHYLKIQYKHSNRQQAKLFMARYYQAVADSYRALENYTRKGNYDFLSSLDAGVTLLQPSTTELVPLQANRRQAFQQNVHDEAAFRHVQSEAPEQFSMSGIREQFKTLNSLPEIPTRQTAVPTTESHLMPATARRTVLDSVPVDAPVVPLIAMPRPGRLLTRGTKSRSVSLPPAVRHSRIKTTNDWFR